MKYWNCLLVMTLYFLIVYCQGFVCFVLYLAKISGTNVAVNKTASHLSSLNFADFLWTADKAVDGCTNQSDPDGAKCCSASEGVGASNYWKVDLEEQYSVGLIIIYGRNDQGGDLQLAGFQVFTQETVSGTEVLLYTQTGDYAQGVFNITVTPERTVISVVVRRPAGSIITLCEVEVYDFSITTTDSTTPRTTQSGQGYSTGVSIYKSGTVWMALITLISLFVLKV